jgi:hypothetical protein
VLTLNQGIVSTLPVKLLFWKKIRLCL